MLRESPRELRIRAERPPFSLKVYSWIAIYQWRSFPGRATPGRGSRRPGGFRRGRTEAMKVNGPTIGSRLATRSAPLPGEGRMAAVPGIHGTRGLDDGDGFPRAIPPCIRPRRNAGPSGIETSRVRDAFSLKKAARPEAPERDGADRRGRGGGERLRAGSCFVPLETTGRPRSRSCIALALTHRERRSPGSGAGATGRGAVGRHAAAPGGIGMSCRRLRTGIPVRHETVKQSNWLTGNERRQRVAGPSCGPGSGDDLKIILAVVDIFSTEDRSESYSTRTFLQGG